MNETRLRTLLGTQHISLLSQHLHKTSQNGFWVAKVLKLKEQNKAMRIGQAVPDRGEMAKNGDSECGEWLWYPRKCWQEMLVDSGISSVLFVALKETSTGKSNHLILCPPGLFGVPKLFSCFLHTFPWVFNNFSQTNEISCYPCFVGAENCQGVNHGSLSERILFQYGDSRGTQCLASIEWPWGSCRIFVWHVRTHPFHHFIPFPPKNPMISPQATNFGHDFRIISCAGIPRPEGMVASAIEFGEVCRKHDFHNFIFSRLDWRDLGTFQMWRRENPWFFFMIFQYTYLLYIYIYLFTYIS